MPKAIRSRLSRYYLQPLQLNVKNITFRPAETFDHYVKSFRLVHDVYVESGYIQPSSTALRIIPHHSHPDSRVFLGMFNDGSGQEVPIYTISVFPDSREDGLPMDCAFKDVLDEMRAEGRSLVEAGCLASEPLFRQRNMKIPMLGSRMTILYSKEYMDADDLVITTHPKYLWLYEDILLFEKIGEIKAYGYVNDNPAVAMRLNLRTIEQKYKKVYGEKKSEKNLYHFLFKENSDSTIFTTNDTAEGLERYSALQSYYKYIAMFQNFG